jgi:hypothetical protein
MWCVHDSLTYVGIEHSKGGYTLVTLPCIVTPYRDSVDETRDRVNNFCYVTRSRVSSTLSLYGVTIRGKVTSLYPL